MKKKVWVGTSWKMNKTLPEAMAFADGLAKAESFALPHVQRFVVPSFTVVRQVKERLAKTSVKVGAQNMHWEDAGAWTGEVSPPMLKECGADLVELGHSERREFFNETDRTVGLKVAAALRHGLMPLVCIGETLAQRESGQADAVLERQVRGALEFVDANQKTAEILFAYEPVWAIGVNGIPATVEYAAARHARIAAVLKSAHGSPVPLLYGGSVNPGNCEELISEKAIDGLFIGRSAWSVEGYLDILGRVAGVLAG